MKEMSFDKALVRKDFPSIVQHVERGEIEIAKRFDAVKDKIETDAEAIELQKDIRKNCDDIIALGKATHGDLTDENGPFAKAEDKIIESVEAYYRFLIGKLQEIEGYSSPMFERVGIKYVVKHFLTAQKFPYVVVWVESKQDRLRGYSYDSLEVELNDIEIINAIDKE